jgi:hypothetical protein
MPQGGQLYPLATVVATWLEEGSSTGASSTMTPSRPTPSSGRTCSIPRGSRSGGEGPLREPVLDLVPGPRGTPGQVLSLITECDFVVIGTSLDQATRACILDR